jgi:hypothetical protein
LLNTDESHMQRLEKQAANREQQGPIASHRESQHFPTASHGSTKHVRQRTAAMLSRMKASVDEQGSVHVLKSGQPTHEEMRSKKKSSAASHS